MKLLSAQAPRSIVMIRPRHFTPNTETAADNTFQTAQPHGAAAETARAAYDEVTRVAEKLEAAGVNVHLFEDEATDRPDAVFPNNWFSTHAGGHVAIYPMFSPSRRRERRQDIIEFLKRDYRVQDVIDYSGLEPDGVYLEGTGAMVLDHIERVAYAVRSNRTHEVALERFCTHFNFEPIMFDAFDSAGQRIYHTNVIMCIGTETCLAALCTVADTTRRDEIRERLEGNGRTVVELSHAQVSDFAGNAIELQGRDQRIMVMSSRARRSLTDAQVAMIERTTPILALDVSTIEMAGGSVRCMLAGVHLSSRNKKA